MRGSNGITYRVLRPAREVQIDLQAPLEVDSTLHRTGGGSGTAATATPSS